MTTVNTVTGPIRADKLGRTLIHEHFLYGFAGFAGDQTVGRFDREKAMENSLQACADVKKYGIQTVVDATTNECGRDPEFLREVSERGGINIICSSGYYYEAESAYAYWKFREPFTDVVKEIEEMMVTELTEGIGGCGIKAGVLKLATSPGEITPMEKNFLTAAAHVQKETGCRIITHTSGGTMGPQQAEILLSQGADPSKTAIGHMCGNTDIDYQKAVLDQGVFVNFDRFGLEGEVFHTPTDDQRIDTLEKLVNLGYGKQIMLSHDSVNYQLGRPNIMTPVMEKNMRHANIRRIGEYVIPEMKRRGFSDDLFDTFLEKNPGRFFGA